MSLRPCKNETIHLHIFTSRASILHSLGYNIMHNHYFIRSVPFGFVSSDLGESRDEVYPSPPYRITCVNILRNPNAAVTEHPSPSWKSTNITIDELSKGYSQSRSYRDSFPSHRSAYSHPHATASQCSRASALTARDAPPYRPHLAAQQ